MDKEPPRQMPFNPPRIEMRMTKSPLEEALDKKQKIQSLRQKYNIKNPKDIKLPKMQWEDQDMA